MVPIQFGYRLWFPSNEEINVRYWETYGIGPQAEYLDPLYDRPMALALAESLDDWIRHCLQLPVLIFVL